MADELENSTADENAGSTSTDVSEGSSQATTEGTDPEAPTTEEKLEQLQKDFDDLQKDFTESKEKIETLQKANEGYVIDNKKLSDDNIEFRTLLKEAKELDLFQDKQLANYQTQILALQDDIENDESQTTLLSTISETTQTIATTTDSILAGSGTVVYYGIFIIPLILLIVFLNWFLKPFITPYR